ncbi:MAG: ribosome small subunit-dependent GTPase A [Verrucomicrobiota bacterium]
MPTALEDLGWNDALEREFRKRSQGQTVVPALVTGDLGISYEVLLQEGVWTEAELAGRLFHEAQVQADLPAVGDWVLLKEAPDAERVGWRVVARLARRSRFSRKVPGRGTEEQVIAANVDAVVIVTDAEVDFNPRRIERFLMLAARGGCQPWIWVNKADLVAEERQAHRVAELQTLLGAPERVLSVSAVTGEGLEAFRRQLGPGRVFTLVGSSGVGKSSLVNRLLGEARQAIGEVSEATGKGRHTTTRRFLLPLKGGGVLIDNPGIREVQLWTDEETLREAFQDLEVLAAECRFRDCRHQGDAGCRIEAAIAQGELSPERYENYLALEDEIALLQKRQARWKSNFERVMKREKKIEARNPGDRFYDPLSELED